MGLAFAKVEQLSIFRNLETYWRYIRLDIYYGVASAMEVFSIIRSCSPSVTMPLWRS